MEKIIEFFLKGENSLSSNIVKSLLIGLIAGLLIGFTGEYWDFKNSERLVNSYLIECSDFCYYGKKQAIIGGIIISLFLFLKYNKKK